VALNDGSANLGELLRHHRRAAGLTQEELAERAGISPRSVSELERGGAHIPRRDTVALLARALGLMGPGLEAFEALVESRRRTRPTRVERPKHNVPRSLTSFIGREQALSELGEVLATAPLLTLVGAGGVGKTRLAHELVRTQPVSDADGSWLIELAGLADPALVPGAVAAAVGLRDFHSRNTTDTLTDYLRPKQLLLVLDNCEHVVAACAQLVAHLLSNCAGLHVLATSRQPLGIGGETTWQVLPLEVPDAVRRQSPDEIASIAAVRLFVERARAVNNTLTLSDDTAPAIARICVGVAGIPLALELAAARTRLLTVEQIADRLERDAGVLGANTRTSLARHQSIRTTIDWSHELLGEQEQALLRRLAVFAGGWRLEMAEEVCPGGCIERADVLDLLAQLVDKSMVLMDARNAAARYSFLEPIRQYALEKLEASGEADVYRARHAATLLGLAQTADAGQAGPDEVASLDRFEVEHDNIRAALRWALTHNDVEAALRSSAALFRFWERRGHFKEGYAWLEQALASAGGAPARQRAWALNALAFLRWRGGDIERAQQTAEQALAVSYEAGTAREISQALLNLGVIAYFRDAPAAAITRLEESVALARLAGSVSQLSVALTYLGRTLLWANGPRDARAAAVLEESLALAEGAQARYATGHALMTLGDLAWRQGDTERAIPLWRRALAARSELADRRGTAGSLERLAWGLAASSRFEEAAWLFGAAEAQHDVLGIALRHDEEVDHLYLVTVARQRLGEAFTTAWLAGQAATVDEAVIRALDGTVRFSSTGPAHSADRRKPARQFLV
jgi:non-specific serine/threonine protein kinase